MEISGIELLIPGIVAALIVAGRQFTASLDGPRAYWVSIALNIGAQVLAELAGAGAGEGIVAATALGLGTGAVVSPGIAASIKRLGGKKMVTPRPPDR